MASRKHASESLPGAERLARALRSGLELRWSIPAPPPEAPTPFPPYGHVRPFLEPYADTLHYPLPRRRHPVLRLVRWLRLAARKLIGPWLHVQTHYNLSALSVIEQIEQRVKALEEAELGLRRAVETLERTFLGRVDPELSRRVQNLEEGFLLRVNQELGCQGAVARAGLWFNPAVTVQLNKSGPHVASVSERILERIFVHTHLPAPPARLLDLGCGESTGAIEMASLGFGVVGVDLRKLPLRHPNFTMVQADLAELPFDDESFDGAVALATLQHVGLGWYTKEERGSSDEDAVNEVFRVLKRGGRFLVTVPFGRPAVASPYRVYDRERLDSLLRRFRVVERGYGVRDGEAWTYTADELRAADADGAERVGAVCLLVLEKP